MLLNLSVTEIEVDTLARKFGVRVRSRIYLGRGGIRVN